MSVVASKPAIMFYLLLLAFFPFCRLTLHQRIYKRLTLIHWTYRVHARWYWPQTVLPHQENCEHHTCRSQHLTAACYLLLWRRSLLCWEQREDEVCPHKIYQSYPSLIDSNRPESEDWHISHTQLKQFNRQILLTSAQKESKWSLNNFIRQNL